MHPLRSTRRGPARAAVRPKGPPACSRPSGSRSRGLKHFRSTKSSNAPSDPPNARFRSRRNGWRNVSEEKGRAGERNALTADYTDKRGFNAETQPPSPKGGGGRLLVSLRNEIRCRVVLMAFDAR